MSGDSGDNSTRQKDLKKSQFIEKAASNLADSDYFDFVKDGQNFKIKLSELITKFGTTGSLEQVGDVTSVATLNQVGTVNQIRGMIGGSGISTSISTGGAIQYDHNFTIDKTGVPIMGSETASSPTLRSILAGSGISVGNVNGSIQVALSAIPATTKTVIINEEADFPTAVAGVITLEDDTQYFITNDITTSSRFVLGENTVVTGSDGTLITLEYTDSGVMFTSANASNKIRDLICKCSSGTFIDISGTGTSEIFQIISCRVISDTIGTIDSVFTSNFQNVVWFTTTDGLTFSNNNSIISFCLNICNISGGTFCDLGTSTTNGFSFSTSLVSLGAGTTFLSGAVDSGNINSGGLGSVVNNRIAGSGTSLNGIDEVDALWEFFANSNISDSRNTCLSVNTNTAISIAATDTPVIIDTNWTEEEASRFTTTSDGRFTYIGSGAFVSLHATITAENASGPAKNFTFYFFKNGSEITNSGVQRAFTAGSPGNVSLLWGDELATNDYIEIFVENNTDTTNITVSKAIVRFD